MQFKQQKVFLDQLLFKKVINYFEKKSSKLMFFLMKNKNVEYKCDIIFKHQ